MKKSEEIKITILKKWMPIYFKRGHRGKCYLCQLYGKERCLGCPIYFETKRPNCIQTPFILWSNRKARENAREMVLFLCHLFRKNKKYERN